MTQDQSPFEWEGALISFELPKRPSKTPNYEAESRALMALAQTVADAPDMIFQTLAEIALDLCCADTAGISFLESQDGTEVLRWKALAGVLRDRVTISAEASSLRGIIDQNATRLLYRPGRVSPALRSKPPIVEALLVPVHGGRKAIGAVWLIAHDERRKFDQEDERLIKGLAQFAFAVWQSGESRTSAQAAAGNRRSPDYPKFAGANPAAIAHDFNNILQVIQAHAALIVSQPAEPSDVAEHARMIEATVEQGVALARQLVAVGRTAETKVFLADINDVLQRTVKSLTPMFPANIVITADLDPRVPTIMVDAGLVYQTVLNLCVNARDAMPNGGKVIVQTRMASGAGLRERFPEARAEQYVYISVADTGVGMAADLRGHVFESHFTTKKPDTGSGLGLSIVHDIVSKHAGFIEVTSEPGCGSTFHIYLPIPAGKKVVERLSSAAAQGDVESRSRRLETVLCADDEAHLPGLLRRLLEGEGFRVLTAQDGTEAVEVHARHKDEITLAILDARLAKLDGWEAFQRMRKINPQLKGILASGYVSADAKSRVVRGELNAVLQKPYDREEVLATIRRINRRS